MPPTKTFAERLATLRRRAGLSQESFGEKFGAGQSTVSSWETGKTSPSVPELIAMCDLFGVAADYLLGRADHEHGLSPDQWIMDEDAVEFARSHPKDARRRGIKVAVKVPRKAKLIGYGEAEALRRELGLE